jgi:nitrate reductase NapE component
MEYKAVTIVSESPLPNQDDSSSGKKRAFLSFCVILIAIFPFAKKY